MYQENIPSTIEQDIQTMIPKLWNLEKWTRPDLPCNNPCSLMRKNLDTLSRTEYMVGAKADGVRAFMLFSFTDNTDQDYVAMVDRAGKGRVWNNIRAASELYSGTLLDGEILEHNDGKITYFVFDIIAISGYTMVNKSHTTRRGEIKRVLSQIRSTNNIEIREKEWFPYGNVNYDSITHSIFPHPCDGFIFVPENGRKLAPGKQLDHFKWKRAEDHTIDFCFYNGELFVEDRGNPATIDIEGFKNTKDATIQDGTIIECRMKPVTNDKWEAIFVRKRPDKTHPNDLRVALLTLENVRENIQLEELMG